jgi:hypothetical protein
LGRLHSFNFFLQWANQIDSLPEERVGLVRHPQLINMKQKKYPYILPKGVWFYEMPTALLHFITYPRNLELHKCKDP